jgi:Sulfotransferase domain
MIYGIKKILKYALGSDIAGRGVAVRPDDTFIVSYPRSGNTWTRFLIANLLHPAEQISFANIERLIPDAEAQSSRYVKRLPSPRVIKSHQYFDHRYPKVIYIVRDPRDVVVSYYDFSRKYRSIDDGFPLDAFVSDFVHGSLSSATWGTWAQNVGTWIAARYGRPDFLLLRYEDLLTNTVRELAAIARFMGVDAAADKLQCAVQRSSAGEMRQLEKDGGRHWVSTRNKREDIPFIGAAASGKWKSKLSAQAVQEIEIAWGPLLRRLGYELGCAAETPVPTEGNMLEEPPWFQPAQSRP